MGRYSTRSKTQSFQRVEPALPCTLSSPFGQISMAMMNRVGKKASSGSLPTRPSRLAVRVQATNHLSRPIYIASGVSLLASWLSARPALAEVATPSSAVDIDSTVDQLIAAIQAAGSYLKSGAELIGTGVEAVKEGYTTAEPYLKQGYNTVAPILKEAAELTQEAVTPVIKAATPVLQDKVNDVVNAAGGNINAVVLPVSEAAQAASTSVAPYLSVVNKFVSSTSPVLLGEYALGGLALYLVTPALFGLVTGSFRGFSGQVAATAALDQLINGGAILVDLRTLKEKEASGAPDLPSSVRDRVQDVEYVFIEDRRLRGLLRDPSAIECQVTALQVAALKRVNKGSTILLMDRNGNYSEGIAKELNAKGYSKVFIISGGFDGRQGWVQSKLQVKPVVSEPSKAQLPSGTRKQLASETRGTRKQLPAPR